MSNENNQNNQNNISKSDLNNVKEVGNINTDKNNIDVYKEAKEQLELARKNLLEAEAKIKATKEASASVESEVVEESQKADNGILDLESQFDTTQTLVKEQTNEIPEKIEEERNVEPVKINSQYMNNNAQTSTNSLNDFERSAKGKYVEVPDSNYAETDYSPKKKKKKSKGKGFLKFVAAFVLVLTLGVAGGVGISYGNSMFNKDDNAVVASGDEVTEQEDVAEVEEQADVEENEPQELVENEDTGHVVNANVSQSLKDAVNSVVCINATYDTMGFGGNAFEQVGSGSGVFFKEEDGKVYILTNNHVVDGANNVTIALDTTDEDNFVDAHLVGKNPDIDIAVLYVEKQDLIDNNIDYKLVEIGNSDEVELLDQVYVIGNAAGEGKTTTTGIISATNKTLETENGSSVSVFQTDASVNPGNSGGALVNSEGELIGINFAKLVDSTIEGMGFAIPINLAVEYADEALADYNPDKAFLGISGGAIDEEMQQNFNLPSTGIYVAAVLEGGGAQLAGIEANDIIVGVDDLKIVEFEDLSNYLDTKEAGDTITIHLYRNNVPKSVEVTLTKYSEVNSGF